MGYKIISSHSVEGLNSKISELMEKGWNPVGGHNVVITHEQNRFRGEQHIDTILKPEYSISMMIDDKAFNTFNTLVSVLKTIREDAQMALNGDWDCTTREGIETGFGAQLELIDNVLENE